MTFWVKIAYYLVGTAISILTLPVMVLAAFLARLRPRRDRPAIFWGVIPIINIKYFSQAAKRRGYRSLTVVRNVYPINSRSDFDRLTSDLIVPWFIGRRLPWTAQRVLGDYFAFIRSMSEFDIFNFYFDSPILKRTPLKFLEMPLLRMAGKKTVFSAYGSDVQVISRFRGLPFKHAIMNDYPQYARREIKTLRDVNYYTRRADYIIAGVDWVDHMPRWDKLVAGFFSIDCNEWKPGQSRTDDKAERPVTVLHAPNHREIKGTRFLVEAVRELEAEGLPVKLQVVEKAPNSLVKELMQECDIVADQFIIGWYAQFAIEGMSLEKPVLTYLRPDLLELYSLYSYAAECPIVNTPPAMIKEALRRLVENQELRRDLGRKGRAYVEKYHSIDSVGIMLDEIYRSLWAR